MTSIATLGFAVFAGWLGLFPPPPDHTPVAGPAPSAGTTANDATNPHRSAPRPGPGRAARSDDRSRATAPAASPTSAATPSTVTIAQRGSGKLAVAPGGTRPFGTGPLVRYSVEVEDSLPWTPAEVAKIVDGTLADPRSWAAAGRARFERVASEDADLRIIIASPALTDDLCEPLDTGGELSCRMGGHVAINAERWAFGADAFHGDVANYRHYVVNHEVGHSLGKGHAQCPAAGRRAPVMMQQTKGVDDCLPNAWPLPSEL
ncbi:DUF3152 domain-containing protein [Actinopolymorpha pittospori]